MTTAPIQLPPKLDPAAQSIPESRRTGKIARLPKETRDMINHMLDDGLPYPVIIDELGEAGEGLNAQNLTNWKQGGYQDYVKTQEMIERVRVQTETAIDLLRGTSDLDTGKINEACRQVVAVQLFTAVLQQGPDAVLKLVRANPDRYFPLLGITCRLADSGLRTEQFKFTVAQAVEEASRQPTAGGPALARIDQGPAKISDTSVHPLAAGFGVPASAGSGLQQPSAPSSR